MRYPPPGPFADATFYGRPNISLDSEETHCEVFSRLTEFNTVIFGKMVGLQDATYGKCPPSRLNPRFYALGRGVEDACGTVVYRGEISAPLLSQMPDPIYGSDSQIARLTVEDHRGRSRQCGKPEAPLILREEAMESGEVKVSRTRYASRVTSMAHPAAPPPELPRCLFFTQPGQRPDREAEPCEIGTYFLEDDGPIGKVVELTDWVDGSCAQPVGVALGRRLYPLGIGKIDACGSITYGKPGAELQSLFNEGPPSQSRVYDLDMIDHRFRERSAHCPDPLAVVELIESVHPTSIDEPPVITRRFYAPQEAQRP